ncbi:MAG: UDP-N-acetylglucosamine 1-carboxyvinyltransferase [Clostridia bacterium]|nr:UDP-N-acetylglucosamine 1-carboxyvinyltransferase [Clostridia bacterium]
MDRLIINGKRCLKGEVKVQGAKNAVLPILAASILSKGKCTLMNSPALSDVSVASDILEFLGCDVQFSHNTVTVDSSGADKYIIPATLMEKMRSSVMFLGAVISRFRKAVITQPGGCDLGSRPIDIHIKALRQLGVEIQEEQGIILCFCDEIKPCKITLDFPSVGATENVMLASCISKGTTVLVNAAREPEIVDLQNFVNAMGGKISGAGTNEIVIEGVKELKGCTYCVMPDRIATATYLCACALCGGEIALKGAAYEHIKSVTDVLIYSGCDIKTYGNDVIVLKSQGKLSAKPLIETAVYPGFPTDAQPVITACMCCAEGKSVVRENIFSDRFRYCSQLKKMGADINIVGTGAFINGTESLFGADVEAMELRGGAALVLAGLKAEGKTTVTNVNYIDRGYEKIEKVFSGLGADIRRETDEG